MERRLEADEAAGRHRPFIYTPVFVCKRLVNIHAYASRVVNDSKIFSHQLFTMPGPVKSPQPVSALLRTPLEYSGSLDAYESIDLASAIGREYPKLQLSAIVNDDTKIRDLAILCSQRGVVFFRNQDIDVEQLKVLTGKLGELTGKPEESKVR